MIFSLEFQKIFSITRTFFFSQNNFGNKIPFFCDIEIILISNSNFFPDLCFRIYLWSWRPYMRILWILDQTRNSFWRESLFKQIFVQKCHIKVRLGWLEDKCLWSVKMTATAWKYTKYKLKIIKVWNSTIYLHEF